jgi:ATP-dependent Zn protease
MSGADLANLCNEAALMHARRSLHRRDGGLERPRTKS